MTAIRIDGPGDLARLDESWPSLGRRRAGDPHVLVGGGVPLEVARPIERDLEGALSACGCDEGALGAISLGGLALLSGLGSRRGRRGSPGALAVRVVIGLLGGAAAGKAAGLAAARARFARGREALQVALTAAQAAPARPVPASDEVAV